MAIVGNRKHCLLLFLLATMFESSESQDTDPAKCASELRNLVVYEGQPADFYCAETTNCTWVYYPSSDPYNNPHTIADESGNVISPYGGFYSVSSTNLRVNQATGQPMINSGSASGPDSTTGIYVLQCPNCSTAANLITFVDSKSKCDCDPSSQMITCIIVYSESTKQPSYPHVDWYDSSGNLVSSDDPSADGTLYDYMFAATSKLPITGDGDSEYTYRVSFGEPAEYPYNYLSRNAPTFTKSYSVANCLMTTTTSIRSTTTTETATARGTTTIAATTTPSMKTTFPATATTAAKAPTTTANMPTTASSASIARTANSATQTATILAKTTNTATTARTTTAALLTTAKTAISMTAAPVSTSASSSAVTPSSAKAGMTSAVTATTASAIVPTTATTVKMTVATATAAVTKLLATATNLVTGSTVAATTISIPTTTAKSYPTGPAQTSTATFQPKFTGSSVGISAISASQPVSKATGLMTTISNLTTTAGSRPAGPVQTSNAISQPKVTGTSVFISALAASTANGRATSGVFIQISAAAVTNTASITSSNITSTTRIAEIRTSPAGSQPTQSYTSATNLASGSRVAVTTISNSSITAGSSNSGTVPAFTTASPSPVTSKSANILATLVSLSASTTASLITATTTKGISAKTVMSTAIVPYNCTGQNLSNTVVYEGTQGVSFPRIDNGQPVQWQVYYSSDFFNGLKTIYYFDGTMAPQYNTSYAVNQSQLTILNATVSPQGTMPFATAGLYILKYLNLNCTEAANLIVIRSGPTCGCDASDSNNVKLSCSVDFAEANSQPNNPIFTWINSSNSAVQEDKPAPSQTSATMKGALSSLSVSSNDATLYQCRLTFGAAPQGPLTYVKTTAPIFTASCYVSNCLLATTKPDTMPTTTKVVQVATTTTAITTATNAILTTLQTTEIVTTGSQSKDDQAATIGGLLGLAFAGVLISAIAFTCWLFRCSLY